MWGCFTALDVLEDVLYVYWGWEWNRAPSFPTLFPSPLYQLHQLVSCNNKLFHRLSPRVHEPSNILVYTGTVRRSSTRRDPWFLHGGPEQQSPDLTSERGVEISSAAERMAQQENTVVMLGRLLDQLTLSNIQLSSTAGGGAGSAGALGVVYSIGPGRGRSAALQHNNTKPHRAKCGRPSRLRGRGI